MTDGLRLTRRALLLATPCGLAACGFHPVYGTGSASTERQHTLQTVYVEIIPERAGQLLRQALQARLDGSDNSSYRKYSLSVSYGVAGEAIAVQQDSTQTRLRYIATATWSLKRLDPARTQVTNGTARSLDGVNIINQQYFAADLESENAQRRLADVVASQITLQLASWFSSHPSDNTA